MKKLNARLVKAAKRPSVFQILRLQLARQAQILAELPIIARLRINTNV
jgi:hypothetical protein